MEKKRFNRTKALEQAGISYLGATKQSSKLRYSYYNGYETYGIYLAPYTLARDENHPNLNLCPFGTHCSDHCLNGAGHNKIEMLANNGQVTNIDKARIRKTHLFYDNRELFMNILLSELESKKLHAEKNNMGFAVRLNCTSDLSLELFKKNGKNILEMYPNIQFYDYTKVPSRLALAEKYPNYDLTFSYDGYNWDVCEKWLNKGGKVAVVFDLYDENGKQTLPKTWNGYKVIDANNSDTRFLDEKGVICGLHYHRVGRDYCGRKYVPKDTPFIVRSL